MCRRIAEHSISCLERICSVIENLNIVQNTKKIMLNSEQLRKISNEDVPKIFKELKKLSLSYQDELRNSYQKHLSMDNFYNEKVKFFCVYIHFISLFVFSNISKSVNLTDSSLFYRV